MPPSHTSTATTAAPMTNPTPQSHLLDISLPINPPIVTPRILTNLEILSDNNLFNTHIADIDATITHLPNPSQSTIPHKEIPNSMDPPTITLSSQMTTFPTEPQDQDNCLIDTPVTHVLDFNHIPLHGSKKALDPSQGTWKRLGPPKPVLDNSNSCLSLSGPK